MTMKTLKRILVHFLVNHVYAGVRCFERKRKLLNSIGYTLGNGTKVVGPLFCTGTVITGENCWLGRNVTVHGNGIVRLGNGCEIAPDVMFLTGGHAIGPSRHRAGVGQTYSIHVEDGCWIGARATLGKQIRVGKGSVIAACACVMRDIPENTLAGGVPAAEIRRLDET